MTSACAVGGEGKKENNAVSNSLEDHGHAIEDVMVCVIVHAARSMGS